MDLLPIIRHELEILGYASSLRSLTSEEGTLSAINTYMFVYDMVQHNIYLPNVLKINLSFNTIYQN